MDSNESTCIVTGGICRGNYIARLPVCQVSEWLEIIQNQRCLCSRVARTPRNIIGWKRSMLSNCVARGIRTFGYFKTSTRRHGQVTSAGMIFHIVHKDSVQKNGGFPSHRGTTPVIIHIFMGCFPRKPTSYWGIPMANSHQIMTVNRSILCSPGHWPVIYAKKHRKGIKLEISKWLLVN